MKRKKWFGLDRFEVIIQILATIPAMAAAGSLPSPASDILVSSVLATSLIVLAWRRRRALANPDADVGELDRVEDLEYRVADLETAQQRILKLEERLDFAERLLTRQRQQDQIPEVR
jgi:hypothetical protein